MIRFAVRAGACICMFVVAAHALAVEPYQEYRKRVESAQTITALGDDFLGDSVSLYNGATEFTATDIDVPGNNALPVRLVRRFVMKIEPAGTTTYNPDLSGAGNWDVDVPYISGMFSGQYGWGSTTTSTQRCSGMYQPSVPARWETMDFWQGYSVHIPGSGDRTLLMSEAETPQPSDGQTHRWSTRERDAFTCIPMLSGLAGEGFSMTTASGVRYDFNVAVSRGAGVMTQSFVSDGSLPLTVSATRVKIFLLASKITDRFGNTVSFQYNADGNPTSITSNDGRSITLTYGNNRLVTATAHGKTWQYQYGSAGAENGMLTTVVLPGSTSEAPNRWTYGYAGTLNPNYEPWDGGSNSSCSLKAPPITNEFDFTVTHPSGASGVFHFANKRHYRSGIHASECLQRVAHGDDIISTYYYWVLHTPNYFDVMSLLGKTITGPGIQQLAWTYDYGITAQGLWGSNATAAAYPCTTCATEKQVVVTNPDATANRYRYGILYASNEGRLLGSSVVSSSGTVVRTQETTFLADADAPNQAFFERYGIIINGDDPSSAKVRPVTREQITQDGATFTRQVDSGCGGAGIYCFDGYANPTKATRFSSLGFSRTDTTAYFHQPAKWILGQIKSTTCVAPLSCAGLVESQTDYDAATAAPLKTYAFGKLQQALTYNNDGTVATVSNGRDGVDAETTITLSGWKRGTPQLIKHPATPDSPTGATQAALVNDDGTLASVTDENGYKTCYAYDGMGRLSAITYPSETQPGVCDSSAWAPTTISFNTQTTQAYGVPGGHWRQTVLTGNGRKILIFDALWRPIVEQTLDLGNVSGTTTEVIKQYDIGGHLAFQSYPMNTAGQAVYTDPSLKGTRTAYDALDRVTQVTQDSELGLLVTTNDYAGFQMRVTNPRTKTTTTSFMAYDQPVVDWPVAIANPAGAYTHITRDAFGKATRLRRSNSSSPTGGTIAINRDYTYNAQQEVCRTVEPETGATLQGFDAAGNLAWSASGLPATTLCDAEGDDAVVLPRKASRTYDARNRVKTLDFADGVGDTTYAYDPDGQLNTITAANDGTLVTTTYQYNRRRLITRERLNWTNGAVPINWPVDYTYNSNGHLASQQWHGLTIDYAPNALGQPTKVGAFASGVTYYPNGAIKGFTYGNGVVHTLTQNMRQLPETSRDTYGAMSFLADSYEYDGNGNVAAITDGATNTAQNGNRTMTYDDLDRLTDVVSPMYGSTGAHYTYDVVDNLTKVQIGGKAQREHYYCYDALTWRLQFLRSGPVCSGSSASAAVTAFAYDVQGNMQTKNGTGFTFDLGNRLRSVSPSSYSLYLYDGHGRRVWDYTSEDKYSHYTHDGRLAMTTDERQQKVDEYIYLGGSLIAIRERDVPTNAYTYKYQHTDALGSPVVVTDAARNPVGERSKYEPYGKVITSIAPGDGPGYTGHVYDAATGMNYMQQRYYDPTIGRFLSVDPVTADGNSGGNFNRYWYANNNPYGFTDPDGRYSCQKSLCSSVGTWVAKLRGSRDSYKRSSAEWKMLNAVLKYVGSEGAGGPKYVAAALDGNAVAHTDQYGTTTIDTSKLGSGDDGIREGMKAITHEGQHDIDIAVDGLALTEEAVTKTETNAYNVEGVAARGVGENISAEKLAEARDKSVENWRKKEETKNGAN